MVDPRFRTEPLSSLRLGLIAAQESAGRRHLMYALVEADLTRPLALLEAHRRSTGERLSLTGYVVTCVARALAEHPEVNAFRRRRSLVFLDEVIVVVLVEQQVDGRSSLGYVPIRRADTRTLTEVTAEIRAGKATAPVSNWGQRLVFALPTRVAADVVRRLNHSTRWAQKYGVTGVNNVGLGADVAGWGLSPGAGTLSVTIGGISRRPGAHDAEHRIAHLTLTFDHDVVDGAPASRFTRRLLELLASAETSGLAQPPTVVR